MLIYVQLGEDSALHFLMKSSLWQILFLAQLIWDCIHEVDCSDVWEKNSNTYNILYTLLADSHCNMWSIATCHRVVQLLAWIHTQHTEYCLLTCLFCGLCFTNTVGVGRLFPFKADRKCTAYSMANPISLKEHKTDDMNAVLLVGDFIW